MKVLFLSASFYPSIGGVETHVLEVANELIKLGHEVTVITELKSKTYNLNIKNQKTVRRSNNLLIVRMKFLQGRFVKILDIWFQLFKNRELLKQADIIHCHDVFVWYFPFRFLYPRKKVFTTFHGYEGSFPPVEKSIFIRKISERLSKGNICVGEFITRWYKTKPDYIVYGGVENNIKYKILNFKNKRKTSILLIGRLSKDIGVQVYKEALRILKRERLDYDFIACGDGEMKNDLKKYGKVLGFVKNTKKHIKSADIIFASSYLTMLSVMQLGKPVFAVYTNPLKHDYLFSSPFSKFVYIYSSGKELARGVKNYKPNLQRLEGARNWANLQTWEKLAQIYLELWKK